VVGKAAGDECVFIPERRARQADEVGSDAIPDAAGGEGSRGAAKPEGVIHRYIFNSPQPEVGLGFVAKTASRTVTVTKMPALALRRPSLQLFKTVRSNKSTFWSCASIAN
jgi:hypothetical protein